jgi:hypothetical protein
MAPKKAEAQETDERTKVWYTGSWVTDGVQEARIGGDKEPWDHYICIEVENHPVYGPIHRYATLGIDCYYDRRDAVLDARRRQSNRLRAMQKTYDRIAAINFEEAAE